MAVCRGMGVLTTVQHGFNGVAGHARASKQYQRWLTGAADEGVAIECAANEVQSSGRSFQMNLGCSGATTACVIRGMLLSPLSALRSPLSALRSPLSALRYLLSAIRYPLSAIRYPLSAIRYPLSAVRYPLSAVRYLLYAAAHPHYHMPVADKPAVATSCCNESDGPSQCAALLQRFCKTFCNQLLQPAGASLAGSTSGSDSVWIHEWQ
eukprot:364963-Chlamydomonas_euryale.AAC.12